MKVTTLSAAKRRTHNVLLGAGFALLLEGSLPTTLYAQTFDRIERERTLLMLSNIKDQLKENY